MTKVDLMNREWANIIINNRNIRLIKDICGDFLANKAFVCGGAIRDALMGKTEVKDLDLFINLPKERFRLVEDRLRMIGQVQYGQYGAPRLYMDNEPYIDVVPFANFDGYGFPVDTINGLLMNFDFTANAIGVNIMTGEFYNPVDGVEDIENKILRAVRVDFPEMPVSDKIALSAVSVFWFRLLHYQAKLGFKFDKATEQWIISNKFRIRDKEMFENNFFKPQIDDAVMRKLM